MRELFAPAPLHGCRGCGEGGSQSSGNFARGFIFFVPFFIPFCALGWKGRFPSKTRIERGPGRLRPATKHKEMKKTLIKSVAATLLLAGTAALFIPSASATPQAGVTSVTIAHGTFDEIDVLAKTDLDPGNPKKFWKAMINTKGASHLYVLQNTVVPGGSFGWHSHTGPSLVIVMSGTATEYEGSDPASTPHLHPAGTTFVDEGEASGHLVRNDGAVNLVVTVVRLVPEGAVQRVDLPNPGFVPGLN